MQLPYSEELNIERFSHLFDKKSESYKLFWFKAIMSKVCVGHSEITFDDLINEMIVDAWYMVTEYHLNLGPSDNLEKVVKRIHCITDFPSTSKREKLIKYLSSCNDREVNVIKSILALNVPYRLQAPLLNSFNNETWSVTQKALMTRINSEKGLLYYFSSFDGLNTQIRIDNDWKLYLLKNQELIRGWIDYNFIVYLQRRNPSVPGISDKLYPPVARDLNKVKQYWKCIARINGGIKDIYSGELIKNTSISIDHFIPWSFVAHDELWNLCPTTRSINSSKSNNLPNWEKYFHSLAGIEYEAYRTTVENDYAKEAFERCAQKHVNSSDVMYRLYRQEHSVEEFTNQLEGIIRPVYDAAKNCGFAEWICA